MLSVLKAGDEVLVSDNSYDPSRTIATQALRDYGISARFFDPLDVEGFAGQIADNTRAVLLDTPLSIDRGEVTDKGSINQRAVLEHRAALIETLYAEQPPAQIIALA